MTKFEVSKSATINDRIGHLVEQVSKMAVNMNELSNTVSILGGGGLPPKNFGLSFLGLRVILNKYKSPHNFVKKNDFRHRVALSVRYHDYPAYGKSAITPLFQ